MIASLALSFISCESSRSGHYVKSNVTADSSVWRCNQLYFPYSRDSSLYDAPIVRSCYVELHKLPNGYRPNDTVYLDNGATIILKERLTQN